MDNIMLQAHKGFGYLILLLALLFIVAIFSSAFTNSGKISGFTKKITKITMIVFHTQALLGVVLLFLFSKGFEAAKASGELMKNAELRKTFVEHPASMIIAAVLLTIINKFFKTNDKMAVKIIVMAVIAIALIGYAFPWARVFGV